MRLHIAPLIVLMFAWTSPALAQNWGTVEGTIHSADEGFPLGGVTVVVDGTNFGTASENDGSFRLRLPEGRYALRFSFVGYTPRIDSVLVRQETNAELRVLLHESSLELEEITVEGAETVEAGVHQIDPEHVRDIPGPFRDVFRSLKVIPGVVSGAVVTTRT